MPSCGDRLSVYVSVAFVDSDKTGNHNYCEVSRVRAMLLMGVAYIFFLLLGL